MIVTSARAAYHLILLHSVRSEELPAPPPRLAPEKKGTVSFKELKDYYLNIHTNQFPC